MTLSKCRNNDGVSSRNKPYVRVLKMSLLAFGKEVGPNIFSTKMAAMQWFLGLAGTVLSQAIDVLVVKSKRYDRTLILQL